MNLRFSSPVPLKPGCRVSYWFPTEFYNADDIASIRVGALFATSAETFFPAGSGTSAARKYFTVAKEQGGTYKSVSFSTCVDPRPIRPETSSIWGLRQPRSTKPTSSIKVFISDAAGNLVAFLDQGVTFAPLVGTLAV